MDAKLQKYYDEIVRCLVRYGKLDEVQARSRIDDSKLFDFGNEIEQGLFFHEEPYYYAMALLHGRENPQWYNNRALWPPPKEYHSPEWRKRWLDT